MDSPQEILLYALDAVDEPLCVVDNDLFIVFVNRAFSDLVSAERAIGQLMTLFPAIQRESIASLLKEGEVAIDCIGADGAPSPVKIKLQELPSDCYLLKVVASEVARDTRSRHHAQRLQTLGTLAGGVAHDFNNMLAGVLGHVSYLKNILPATGPHVESLLAIEEGGKKASIMTQQILKFSKFEAGDKPARVNLSELVIKTCILLRGAISPSFKLEREVAETELCVLANEAGLAQILVNLVINARDALQQNGAIYVRLEVEHDQARLSELFEGQDLAAQRYVKLSVRDTGHGMSQEVMEQIFQPYFSTKKEKGNGLGLATVLSLVRSYGGAISVSSAIGEGTVMEVYLPEAQLPAERAPEGVEGGRRARLMGGDESILVVDDESPVRNVVCMSLQHLGYDVEGVSSGLEAIERFSRGDKKYDLVLLDMLMPQISGEKTYFKLQELSPDVRVLIISGYSSEEAVKNILAHGGKGFLQKPFTIDELSKKVRDCLDQDQILA
jgi:two-component system cell cycle sensor histidine kinase/response regulator CckA